MVVIGIVVYIGTVFLNRWLNKVLYKEGVARIVPLGWFLSLITTAALVFGFIDMWMRHKKSWFTGKNW